MTYMMGWAHPWQVCWWYRTGWNTWPARWLYGSSEGLQQAGEAGWQEDREIQQEFSKRKCKALHLAGITPCSSSCWGLSGLKKQHGRRITQQPPPHTHTHTPNPGGKVNRKPTIYLMAKQANSLLGCFRQAAASRWREAILPVSHQW